MDPVFMAPTLLEDNVMSKIEIDGKINVMLLNEVKEVQYLTPYEYKGKRQFHRLLRNGGTVNDMEEGAPLLMRVTQQSCPDGSIVRIYYFPRVPKYNGLTYQP